MEAEGVSCLIPGLPNDVVLNCLVRVCITSHTAMLLVSKGWRDTLLDRNSVFYTLRSQLGLIQPAVFLVPSIPSIQDRDTVSIFFKKAAILCPYKSLIFVMGGEEVGDDEYADSGKRTKDFYIVDTLTRKIRRGPDMVYPTSVFAHSSFGILNNRLYVVGGLKDGDAELTALSQCYDILSNTWMSICPLPFLMVPHMYFVAYSTFNVLGVFIAGPNKGEMCYVRYADDTDSWSLINTRECFERLKVIQEEVRAERQAALDDDDDGDECLASQEEEEEEEDDDDNEHLASREDEQEEEEDGDEETFEEQVKARVKEITRGNDGPLTANSSLFGMFILHITDDKDDSIKWKNMGDIGRILQSKEMSKVHPDQYSLMARDALPSITIRHDDADDDKELHFSGQFKIIHFTGIRTPHYTKWRDTPLLFYPVCGEFSFGCCSKLCSYEFVAFDFVVVCY